MDFYWSEIENHERDAKTIGEIIKYKQWKDKVMGHKFFKVVMMESYIHDDLIGEANIISHLVRTEDDVKYFTKLFPKYKLAFEEALEYHNR